MSKSVDLLKMLEPVVRPGATAPARGPIATPIESRSFDSILADAQSMAQQSSELAAAGPDTALSSVTDANHQSAPAAPLRSLADVNQIENAALRNLLALPVSVDTSNQKV